MHIDSDLEEINQFVLYKQHLAEHSNAQNKCLVEVVKDICGPFMLRLHQPLIFHYGIE